jgi:hypothetical protein
MLRCYVMGERVFIFLHDLNVCDKRCVCLDCNRVFYFITEIDQNVTDRRTLYFMLLMNTSIYSRVVTCIKKDFVCVCVFLTAWSKMLL